MATYTEKWLDYILRTPTSFPSSSAIKASGFTGMIRYITAPSLMNPVGYNQKHMTKAEYDERIQNGIKVRCVFQGSTTDADGGYAKGVTNAGLALAGANMLGYKGVIFFTNDRPDLPSVANWQAYLDGAASVLGKARVGAYGFQNAMNAAVGHASAFWQAGSESKLVGHANYYQWNNGSVSISGITCDINYVIKDYDIATSSGGSSSPASDNSRRQDVIEKALPLAASDGFVEIPASGYAGAKVVIYPGRGADGGIQPVWLDHLYNYGSGRVGTGGDPGSGDQVTRIDWPTEFTLPTGTLTVGVGYSTNADAIVRTFG